jgi:DNA-binding YbaB/EbfC family protein
MANYQDLMRKAQDMQKKMEDFRERFKSAEVEGSAGGGLVKVKITGGGNVKVAIDASLVKADEKDVLEDLLAAATMDARQKMEKLHQEEMSKITGGFSLPGMS